MKIISIFLPYLGCQQRCIFCNQQILNDVFVAPAEIQIRKKISAAIDTLPKGGDAEIAFFGCSFTSMPLDKQEMYLKIADEFKDSVNGIRISAHPNSFPKEVIRLLKKYDVTTVELGVESMSSAVLKESGRKYSSDDIINNIKVLKSAGLKVVGQLMLGLPGDTKRRFIKSVKDLADTKIDFIRLHPTLVLKNTDLEVKYIQNEYQPLSLEEALEWLLDAFDVLEESKIPLIRIGLFPSKSLVRQGNIVAGPFHPSLGELFKGRVFRKKVERQMPKNFKTNSYLELKVNTNEVPKAYGYKKENIFYFIQKYHLQGVKVTPSDGIKSNEFEITLSH